MEGRREPTPALAPRQVEHSSPEQALERRGTGSTMPTLMPGTLPHSATVAALVHRR